MMDRIDWTAVERLIDLALAEDLGAGDITTDGIVSARARGTGQVTAKQTCVVSGLFLAERVYRRLDPDVKVELLVAEGKRVTSGTVLCRITGQFRALLAGERTVLNFLQRQCGIATLTHRFVRKVSRTKARIYDTRKTAPGMRTLDKYAVRTGGGCNHRMGLYDAILIKENHIAAAGGVDRAIARARKAHPDVVLEVEVRNFS
ncbi:MAG: carboxylating nicotinate-nucleotide diphosphorylase, partial [Deltaproteobacteria bacterium]|nr:carboxylating nicotinate-nucleotide diphosphorylase [Deltaproteobacteria bacterium]